MGKRIDIHIIHCISKQRGREMYREKYKKKHGQAVHTQGGPHKSIVQHLQHISFSKILKGYWLLAVLPPFTIPGVPQSHAITGWYFPTGLDTEGGQGALKPRPWLVAGCSSQGALDLSLASWARFLRRGGLNSVQQPITTPSPHPCFLGQEWQPEIDLLVSAQVSSLQAPQVHSAAALGERWAPVSP